MKLKDLFKRTKKGERPAKIAKTKTVAAEMILDNELMKMVSGGYPITGGMPALERHVPKK